MIIHAFIRFCMVLNPTMCQELELHLLTTQLSPSLSACAA
jgi:hypothetical protein